MPGDRRLADRKLPHEVSDRALALEQQVEDAATMGLGDDLERGDHVSILLEPYIKIKLCTQIKLVWGHAPGGMLRGVSPGARRCRRKFLAYFPDAFRDEHYLESERSFKWRAHRQWAEQLGREEFADLLAKGMHREIAMRAVRIEARTILLFSFEKMALRDAVGTPAGARAFAEGLYVWLYGRGPERERFARLV